MPINIAPADVNLSVSLALPAANSNNTTGVLDLQAIALNSNAWQLGRIKVTVPVIIGNNTGAGITFAIQAAPPSLTGGAAAIAPKTPGPGAFAAPNPSQTVTVASVAVSGSAANVYYFNLPTDSNGSTFQFIQFLQTVPANVNTQGEVITYAFVSEYGN